MRKIISIFCFVIVLVGIALFANEATSSKAIPEIFVPNVEAMAKSNDFKWEYGYLRGYGRCSGNKKVKVVSEVIAWCPKDFDYDYEKFKKGKKSDVLKALSDTCGSSDYILDSYIFLVRRTKEKADEAQKADLEKKSCSDCQEVAYFKCSCFVYSNKCKD